jgi:hypothetical protein
VENVIFVFWSTTRLTKPNDWGNRKLSSQFPVLLFASQSFSLLPVCSDPHQTIAAQTHKTFILLYQKVKAICIKKCNEQIQLFGLCMLDRLSMLHD